MASNHQLIGIVGKAGSGKDTVAGFLREHHGFASLAFADPLKAFVQQAWGLDDGALWGPSEQRSWPITGPMPDLEPRMVWACPCGHVGDLLGVGGVALDDPAAAGATSVLCRLCRKDTATLQPLTPRLALQTLGTNWGRALDSDVWTRMGIHRARKVASMPWAYNNHGPDGAWRCTSPPFSLTLGRVGWPPHLGPFTEANRPEGLPTVAGVVITDCRFANEAAAIQAAGGLIWRVDRPSPPPEPVALADMPEDCVDVVAGCSFGIGAGADTVYLIRRDPNPEVPDFHEKWCFPGGKVEPGESHAEALVREWAEECRGTIEVGHLLTSVVRTAEGYPRPFRVSTYFVTVTEREPAVTPAGGTDDGWVPVRASEERPFALADLDLIDGTFAAAWAAMPEDWRRHASETEQDAIVPNVVLINDGSLDDLRAEVALEMLEGW